jgi:hypothetical protein
MGGIDRWTLEDAAYSAVIQAWDFRPGANFILEMHKAAEQTQKTILVLSEDYLKAEFTKPEWCNTPVAPGRRRGRTFN